MSTKMIPVGNAVIGRVLNADGEPIDHKGDLDHAPHVPLYIPQTLPDRKASGASIRMLETGIKVIDLMAPVFYGSSIGTFAEPGLGWIVVVEEILNTFITRHQAVPVIAGMSETAYAASSLRDIVREIEAEDHVVMFFEQANDVPSIGQQLLHAAMTTAVHFGEEGREVLLIIDDHLATQENMAELQHFASTQGITSIVPLPINHPGKSTNDRLNALDVQWIFSSTRAKQGFWPAIDPVASRSRLLESPVVSEEHRRVAQQVRDVLQRYYDLQGIKGSNTLSEKVRHLLARGERINLFLTQPFVVAEAYTDLPGTYLTIEETLKSFRDLLDGRYDEMPVQAFNFVGNIKVN